MTAFHVAGLAIIVLAWVWIALVMRLTWPAVRAFWCGGYAGHDVRGGKCTRCGWRP